MAIAYIDKRPSVEVRNGHFLITAISGTEQVQLIFTRHAIHCLGLKITEAEAKQRWEELGGKVTPFQQRKMRDAQRAEAAAES